jgi:hypothetical protein
VPKHLTSFAFALVRAKALNKEFEKATRRYQRLVRKKKKEGIEASWLDSAEVVVFSELWMAALQVVVEGYERSHKHPDSLLSDPAVDALLDQRYAATSHREMLRRFRNTVFHPESVGHPDALAVLEDHEHFAKWADRLTKELGRLLHERLRLL